MKKNINVNLIEIPEDKHEMYEMGISFDRVYRIDNENEIPIGIVYISDLTDGKIYIEWLEIMIAFQGKGYLRQVMYKLAELFKNEIQFECSEYLRLRYMHVGCNEHGIDELTENYRMSFNESIR